MPLPSAVVQFQLRAPINIGLEFQPEPLPALARH